MVDSRFDKACFMIGSCDLGGPHDMPTSSGEVIRRFPLQQRIDYLLRHVTDREPDDGYKSPTAAKRSAMMLGVLR